MPSPEFGKAELDPDFRDADVRNRRELQTAAERVARQRGDQRDAQARERFESAVSRTRPVTPHLQSGEAAPGGDVAAGAEGVALAGEDRNSRVVRGFDRARGLRERVHHRAVERVQLVGPLHRDTSEGAFKVELDEGAH